MPPKRVPPKIAEAIIALATCTALAVLFNFIVWNWILGCGYPGGLCIGIPAP